MVDQARARRLEKRINAIVALAIEREIKDPGLAGVTIVDTKVTADLHDATVYLHGDGTHAERRAGFGGAAAALERAKGALRTKVGAGTGVRFTPTLDFSRDTTSDNVQRMDGAAGPRPRRRRRPGAGSRGCQAGRGRRSVP